MTTPEVAKDLFTEAQAAFTPIVGAPNNNGAKRLTKAFINALQSINVPGGAINLSKILLSDTNHEAKHGVGSKFERMTITLPAYDNSIATGANNVVRAKVEATWKAAIANERLYDVAERETRRFIFDKVKDTWVRKLKNACIYYTKVHTKDLLDCLQSLCLGTYAINYLSPQIDKQKYYQQADGIPEYINMLEDDQRTALRIDETNPITDTSVLNIATAAMLSSQQFPRTTEEWEDVPPVDKHWQK